MRIVHYDSAQHFDQVLACHIAFLDELASLRPDISKRVGSVNAERVSFEAFIHTEKTDCFVLVEDNAVVGYSISYPCKTVDPLHYEEREFAFLDEIYVCPSHRRRGYAGRVIQHLKEVYQSRGLSVMELYVLAQNGAAQSVYQKSGFRCQSIRMEIAL